MRVPIKTNIDFERSLTSLNEKYGEDFEILNGLHEAQLNFSDFIDGFIDKNVTDVTIDANANAANKDIRSLLSEKGKSHDKLFAANKIFHEFKKKYGLNTAKEWLETEYNGAFYLHDFPSATYVPYCVLPEETCFYTYQGKILHGNFDDIYNMLPEQEEYLPEIKTYAKFPKGLRVQDKNGWVNVSRICWHENKDKKMHFIKTKNGQNIITTEDHTFFKEDGSEVEARHLVENDKLDLTFNRDLFTGSITRWCGRGLTEDLGWFIGFILAEGTVPKKAGMIQVSQSTKSKSDINKFLRICDKYGIGYRIYDYQKGVIKINIKAGGGKNSRLDRYNWRQFITTIIHGNHSHEKHLNPEYVNFNNSFLMGIVSGLFDGDGTVGDSSTFSIRISSRTLLNQVQAILLNNNIVVSGRVPYIQTYEYDRVIKQTKPAYGVQVNMNAYPEFFEGLKSNKISEKWVKKEYSPQMANKNYSVEKEDSEVIENKETFNAKIVYDLTTDTGSFVCNNIKIHNCYAYDLTRLATEGLFFLDNYNNVAPQHLTTFIDDVIEFISYFSNRSSGAVGLPNVLIWTYYFWKKDCKSGHIIKDKDYYIRQNFQKLIYRLNQPFMRIDQTAFVNFSIFDRNYIESLFGGVQFPDGSYAIDQIEEIIEHQKVFMEVVSEIRAENMFTFPVLTYSLLYRDGKFQDEEFARWCSDHNAVWNDSNFFQSEDVNTLSNCPLAPDTRILYRREDSEYYRVEEIEDLYHDRKFEGEPIKVLANGKEVSCKINRFNEPANYSITLVNGLSIRTTENHLNKVYGKDYIMTKDLTTDDYLPCNLTPFKNIKDYSFISDEYEKFAVRALCNDEVIKTDSTEYMNNLITASAIHGITCDVTSNYKTIYGFGDKKYMVRLLDNTSENIQDFCIKDENYMWFKIKEIKRVSPEVISSTEGYSYCLEVLGEGVSPEFMLANGIVTHNCRLLSDTSKLSGFINSIGGTALSIGSVKVNTINLVRIALEAEKNEEEYLKILKDRTVLCCKTLDIIRHIINRNIEKGLLPNYQDGGIEMDKQYSTIGILGLYEAVEYFGYTKEDEFGNIGYTDKGIEFASKIFEVLNSVKDNFTDDYSFNIESVPAERAAVILCQKDNQLYGLKDKAIYSNQWIPLSAKCTIQEKLRLSSILDEKCSGGSIAHINLEGNFPNKDMAWEMLNKIAASGVFYFAFNTRINECINHHGFVGSDVCPHCGGGVHDTYQRIVGYLVPTRNYSKDRFKEFTTRRWYEYAEMLGE